MNQRAGGVVVFAVAACLYLPTIRYDFAYDDVRIIAGNPLLHSLHNWRVIVSSPWWENALYRPLTSLTLAIDWSVGGGRPALFHLSNVILHAIASLLVYGLACRLVGRPAGLVAALLFAVHPVHVEAVANVVGRAEVLATLFTILAALAYAADGDLAARGDAGSARRWLTSLGTLAAALCAFASKESAFALPALLLLVDWWDAREVGEPFATRIRRHLVVWSACVGLTVAWLWLRAGIIGDVAGTVAAPGLQDLGLVDRTLAMIPVAVQYARLLFFPARLSADYSPDFLPLTTDFSLRVVAGLLVIAAALFTAVTARRRQPGMTFSIAWIGASLFIVSNILVPTGVALAERTLYLASVGACLLVGFVWDRLFACIPAAAMVAALLAIMVGAARSLTRTAIWRSNDTLFPQLVRDAPGSFRAYWVDGMLHYQAGDRRSGEGLLRKGLHVYPLTGSMWRDLGNRLQEDGRWKEAASCFWTAFRLDSTSISDAARAVMAGLQGGNVDSAEARLRMAAAMDRDGNMDLKLAASHVAMARGQPLRALSLRHELALASPSVWEYWYLTAKSASEGHNCTALLESLDRLDRLQPRLPDLRRLREGADQMHCGASAGPAPGMPENSITESPH